MTKFRHPKDMNPKEEREPVSARLKISTKAILEEAAKKHKLSLAELISNVLDDYAEWLKK
jgi:uncharacterized protein (DUF1778 family)